MYRRYKKYLAGYRVAEFKTRDGQAVLNKIAQDLPLTHLTLTHIRSFLSNVFRFARRQEIIASDPIADVEVPRGKESEDTEAYTEKEVDEMIEVLDGVGRLVVIVAANTALSLGELQGLQWADIGKETLTVNRII
jgi:integrase